MKLNVDDTLEVERDTLLAHHQLHIQSLPVAYLRCDVDFRIIDWNPTAERVFGYAKEEILGLGPPYELIVPRSFWDKGNAIRDRMRSGEMQIQSTNENVTKDGRTITCQWVNTPLTANGKFAGGFCICQDITPQKHAEEQMAVLLAKMEDMGTLAADVAHKLNDLLTIIIGFSEILISQFTSDDPMRVFLIELQKAGVNASNLTAKLTGIRSSIGTKGSLTH